MKVWVTRPSCDEIYMGGMRRVRVWLDKPVFDHRAQIPDFNLIDPQTRQHVASVYHENGWTSESGGLIASPFLEQDRHLYERVWDHIYHSCMPMGFDKPLGTLVTDGEYKRLIDLNYERQCLTHWKRFLLEIDLCRDDLHVISPLIMDGSNQRGALSTSPLSETLADNSQFFEQDLTRPYIDRLYIHLEMSREPAWI